MDQKEDWVKFGWKSRAFTALPTPVQFFYYYQIQWIFFLFATSIFIGLSYTGNSAVSNYTSVRKETARFLPLVVLLYLALIPIHFFGY